jgi:hypothetical protein
MTSVLESATVHVPVGLLIVCICPDRDEEADRSEVRILDVAWPVAVVTSAVVARDPLVSPAPVSVREVNDHTSDAVRDDPPKVPRASAFPILPPRVSVDVATLHTSAAEILLSADTKPLTERICPERDDDALDRALATFVMPSALARICVERDDDAERTFELAAVI